MPCDSPVEGANAEDAGALPKALVFVPKGELVETLPNGFDGVDVFVPKPGLFCPPPNNELPGFDVPNGDACAAGVDVKPKPPKPPAVAVPPPPPNKLLPDVVVVVPNPDGLGPNALFWGVPKPVGNEVVSN